MEKYALITGGAGFIGSHIAQHLLNKKLVDKVVLLDHFGRYVNTLNSNFYDYRKLRFLGFEDKIIIERGDSKYFSVVSRILRTYQPDYIFHMAALPLAKLPNLNTEEAREGSVDSTSFLLETIGQIKLESDYLPKRFIYASSSMVYGDLEDSEFSEESKTNPKEIYGIMKLAGEVITKGLGEFFGIPYSIIRPSAVYGPTDMNRRVTQIFVEKAMLGQSITVQGHDEKLDFTHVKDVANGFVLAAIENKGINEIFNITHGSAHTLLDFIDCLKANFPDLDYIITERDAFRPKRGTLSINKANDLIGYSPQYTLKKGIDEYIEFIKKHNPTLLR